MQHDLNDPDPDTRVARNPALWWLLGALLVAQLLALWGLCSQQVRKAQARSAEVQMTQMALSDCLQYIPGSTFATCSSRLGLANAAQPPVAEPDAAQRVTAVSYTVR